MVGGAGASTVGKELRLTQRAMGARRLRAGAVRLVSREKSNRLGGGNGQTSKQSGAEQSRTSEPGGGGGEVTEARDESDERGEVQFERN
ncbi:unnamed protein product [Calypogeia fissa]